MGCDNCENVLSVKIKSTSKLKARLTARFAPAVSVVGDATLKLNSVSNFIDMSGTFKSISKFKSKLNLEARNTQTITGEAKVRQRNNMNFSMMPKVTVNGEIVTNLDKFVGSFSDTTNYEKLYPDFDYSSFMYFPNSGVKLTDVVDEGVYSGPYHINDVPSQVYFDDSNYIYSNNRNGGNVVFGLSSPTKSFKESKAIIRASSNSAYKIHDIEFKDPIGRTICKYEDIIVSGDESFTTYSSNPVIDNGTKYSWDENYITLDQDVGPGNTGVFYDNFNIYGLLQYSIQNTAYFTLNFKTSVLNEDRFSSFDDGFNDLFDDSDFGSRYIRVSATEVSNSGDFGFFKDEFLPFYIGVQEKGLRIQKSIKPQKFYSDDKVQPLVNSIWQGTYGHTSQNEEGRINLGSQLAESYDYSNAVLMSGDSGFGDLKLQFGLQDESYSFSYKNGEFAFAFDEREFPVAKLSKDFTDKSWFIVDEIFLKVRAKKATGGSNFALDVVGYTNDGLLNISTPFNFLDNKIEGSGTTPVGSGWNNLDNEAMAGEAISDLSEYFEGAPQGANHYQLSSDVIVNSETFQEYLVPLRVLKKDGIGDPIDYSQIPSFEKLFVDIYPIPIGAAFSSVELVVTYKPSNALSLTVLAGNLARIEKTRSESSLRPIAQGTNDDIVNAGSGYGLPSLIENIPHGYKTPATLKTNYARRWTGIEGSVVSGPFNPYQFDFGFSNPQLTTPFINGYYDFSLSSGNYVLPRKEKYSLAQPIQFSSLTRLKNIGLRQGTKTILLDSPHAYESVATDEIKAADAYDTVLLNKPNAVLPLNSGGFSAYLKFTLEAFSAYNVLTGSGLSLDIDTTSDSFKLTLASGNISVPFSRDKQFPYYLILTYNEHNNGKLSLYGKHDSEETIYKSDIAFAGGLSGVTLNANFYLHELGLSNNNIVDENLYTPNLLAKELSVQSFLDGKSMYWSQPGDSAEDNEYSLPSYIDESTLDFDLGAFRSNQFTSEFDMFTKRVGKDFIGFSLNGSGAYNTQLENDFLRFNLSDTADNFYSTTVRIEKGITEGYIFNKRAIVAETVVDYSQEGSVIWSDGKIGPKLIVSLYTKNSYTQEMYPDIASASGDICLVNRKEFYLDPWMSWERLDCTFDPDTYWGYNKPHVFNAEFDHKYVPKNLDTMFLQYDLEVPSGNQYSINLNIHAATVVLDDAIVKATEVFNSVNIHSIAEFMEPGSLPLVLDVFETIDESLILHSLSDTPASENESVNLISLGGTWSNGSLSLLTLGNLKTSSDVLLHTNCQFDYAMLNLLAFNDEETVPFNVYLPMVTDCAFDATVRSAFNLTCFSSIVSPRQLFDGSETLPLYVTVEATPESVFTSSDLNLYVLGPKIGSENLNLFMNGVDLDPKKANNQFNLHTIAYPLVYLNGSGTPLISWNTNNVGRGTEEFDESYLSIPASADIRDQEGICWGDCSSSGTCQELEVETHGTVWNEAECVQGGILRPLRLNNQDENPDYYEGGFYGARKYTGLFPNAAYDITMSIKTGSTDSYDVPNVFEEWEYGRLGDIKYSGVKLVADQRFVHDNYGKAVKTKGDLTAVSAPGRVVGGYDNAGSVFLYRRQAEVAGGKASWSLEEELTLPSGFIDDYYYEVPGRIFIPTIGTIPERQWQIGQEGREFGHSIDLTKTEDRELLVVGGPGAKWSRTFDNIETSGVNFALFIFSDEFDANTYYFDKLFEKLEINNFLFKYFAEPAVHINMKVINIFPTGIFNVADGRNDTPLVVPKYNHPNVIVQTIPRTILNQPINEETQEIMVSGMKNALQIAYPFNSGEINNNIPPLVGFYVDNSRSLGRKAIEPAIDRFFNFYQDYAFQSGVKDFYGIPSSGFLYEKELTREDEGESHFALSSSLIDEILDTGRLMLSGNVSLLTSGVGLEFANSSALEFNLMPDSGGRVYVFEKYGQTWDLIQQINSPDNATTKLPNRFGHSVSISESGNVIAVGSPYIRESCSVYELDKNERNRLYGSIGQWLKFRDESTVTQGQYYQELERFKTLEEASGTIEAGIQLYDELTPSDKFKARSDKDFWGNNDIKEFKKVYAYGMDDIEAGLKGQFLNVPRRGAPNPRLGYSSSINDDGTVIAFGSPTDSLGVHDNADFYFKHEFYFDPENPTLTLPSDGTWASNVNSGAVRIFERERLVVPTSPTLVLEYNRFGNLSNTLNGTEGYDEEGNEINSTEISQNDGYDKTDFSDFRIPDEAGAIFIVTPEVDAANDEVIAEIKRWLALGDRRLVLVGDDPIWEKNGAYAQSNAIINKILDRLDSRMRLNPARNEYEALLTNNNYDAGDQFKTNVIKSFAPAGSNDTSVEINNNLNAFGVADIRFYAPDITFTDNNWGKDNKVVNGRKYGLCRFYNPLCGPFIGDGGDLRAEWTERELKHPEPEDDSDPYTYWKRNLPFEYFSNGLPPVLPREAVKIAKDININDRGLQPRPLMVAAEFKGMSGIIPAIPEIIERQPIYGTVEVAVGSEYYLFSESGNNNVEFRWKDGSGILNYVNSNLTNNPSLGLFYNPVEDFGKNPLLQARGTISTVGTINESYQKIHLDNHLNFAARQRFDESEIYLIAGIDSENYNNISNSRDHNISFYDNLVKTNCQSSFILQLGGWTGRSSFKDAFVGKEQKSLLPEVFTSLGHTVEEGWNAGFIPATKDVLWIANSSGVPTQGDANIILDWLRLGNKKLVITYDGTQESAFTAYQICRRLNTSIRPWFLPEENSMAMWSNKNTVKSTGTNFTNIAESAIIGCDPENAQKVEEFSFISEFCPIQTEEGFNIIYNSGEVFDRKLNIDEDYKDLIKMNTGVTKVQFPAIPGSGYRIYYRWYSDFPGENQEIDLYCGNVHYKDAPTTRAKDPLTVTGQEPESIYDYDADGDLVLADKASLKKTVKSVSFGDAIEEGFVDVQVPYDRDFINFFACGNRSDVIAGNTQIPRTCKLLDVSGVLLPIEKKVEIQSYEQQVIIGYRDVVVQEYVPPSSIILPPIIRPIMTDNTKYCVDGDFCGGKLVADGPVVIAEEPETFSNFVSGKNRSTVVLISDSSLVNGRSDKDQYGTSASGDSVFMPVSESKQRIQDLINSLTSIKSSDTTNDDRVSKLYSMTQKIVSPETGDCGVYSLANTGVVGRFNGSNVTRTLANFTNESNFEESKIVPHIWPVPPKKKETWEEADKRVSGEFDASMSAIGFHSKFKYTIDGTVYEDSPLMGDPFSKLLIEKGVDFIDEQMIASGGYSGDLFGYSVSISGPKGKEKVFVGTPFNAWKGNTSINYSGVNNLTQLEIGNDGGAGSAFLFKKDNEQGWLSTDKFKPTTIGISNSNRFGYTLDSDGDFLVVGAPCHDYGNSTVEVLGEFVRKEFDSEFSIGTRVVTDLGSGISYSDAGATYTFEDKLYDWSTRSKAWVFAEKLTANGFGYDETNTKFGRSVSISRNNRLDSDYSIVHGSRNSYASSGTAIQKAGAAYINDAMLRHQPPSVVDDSSWFSANVFGSNKTLDFVRADLTNLRNRDEEYVRVSGTVYSDSRGQIILEASGQDPREFSFITQRPYIERIEGVIVRGTPLEDSLILHTVSDTLRTTNSVNLHTVGPDSDTVYNSLNMVSMSAHDASESGLTLVSVGVNPETIDTSGIILHTNGIGILNPTLDLRVRGK